MVGHLLIASTLEEDTFCLHGKCLLNNSIQISINTTDTMRLDDSKHLHNNVVWQSTNIKCSPSHQLNNQVVSYKYFMYMCCTLVKRPANHLTLQLT